jgi:hypothetical protein
MDVYMDVGGRPRRELAVSAFFPERFDEHHN